MNLISRIFEAKLLAYVIAAFTGLAGFYITTVVEEVRTRKSAIYSFEKADMPSVYYFHLENISREKSIHEGEYYLMCEDGKADCFLPIPATDPAEFVQRVTNAPNYGAPIGNNRSSRAELRFCLGAIPDSTTGIAFMSDRASTRDFILLYDPWATDCGSTAEEPGQILLLKPFNLHAIAAKYYFAIISVALIVSALALLIGGFGYLRAHAAYPTEDNDEDTEKPRFEFWCLSAGIDRTDRGDRR